MVVMTEEGRQDGGRVGGPGGGGWSVCCEPRGSVRLQMYTQCSGAQAKG